ncbi:XRE family transcriptional regulator [Kordiimonas sp. SCSIO 12610]|uniref:helix-turn-helix domain-containing protein n=1 Tax=Kordiimonas sp. SCSIO 12610 TaxID=2829597 RepID=UPI002109F4C4|nr:XRE family transcriptional regulator [Kordiimonas sp. SCSIO 12610]UTW56589.1 helix-turn-helix transcriptional regulator [Kordiimonas sp. SCSIO 12610]
MINAQKSLIAYRQKLGLTQKQLGLSMGMSEKTILQIENGARAIPEKLHRFHTLSGTKNTSAPKTALPVRQRVQRLRSNSSARCSRRDLPVLGCAQGGKDGNIIMNDTAIDWTFRPTSLEGVEDAFAVFVTGDSMAPRYLAGDLVYVHPNQIPRRGHFVLVELTGHKGFIKQFIKWQDDELVLWQFNPEKEIRITRNEILNVKVLTGGQEK